MNKDLLIEKLLRAGRETSHSSEVPYAFEKRIMAHVLSSKHLGSKPDSQSQSEQSLWALGLWRAAMGSLAIAMVTGGLHLSGGLGSRSDFRSDFEHTDAENSDPVELALLEDINTSSENLW